LARIFTGSETDRAQVYGLVGHLQALALVSGGSVTLLSHPSLQGINSGSGLSGSTGWHDAFRFRQYLRTAQGDDDDELVDPENDNGLRELAFLKNQYGPPAARITLRYQRGLFLPETGVGTNLEKLAAEMKADTAFLELLDRFEKEGRKVGVSATSTNYGPTLFAKEKVGFNKSQLEAAMRRLFKANKIRATTYGRASNQHQRIVRVGPDDNPT
jgi:RecA-family ATPase